MKKQNSIKNVIELPTAKTELYYYPQELDINDILEMVWSDISTVDEQQKKQADEILEIEEQLREALPPDKIFLLDKFLELRSCESSYETEKAIKWVLTHEKEINERILYGDPNYI